jgi:hypothetical protein
MFRFRQLLIYVIAASLLLLGVMACQDSPLAENDTATDTADLATSDTGLIHHDGPDSSLAGNYLIGILAFRNDCIRLDVPDAEDENAPPISYLTIWPPGFHVEYTSDAIVIMDDRMRPVSTVTDIIWVEGGPLDTLPPEIEAQRPSDCSGPFLYINSVSFHIPF